MGTDDEDSEQEIAEAESELFDLQYEVEHAEEELSNDDPTTNGEGL